MKLNIEKKIPKTLALDSDEVGFKREYDLEQDITSIKIYMDLLPENDVYTELKKSLPKLGMMFDTPEGMGKVVDIDVFNNTYSVDLAEKGIIKFPGDKRND